MKLRELKYIILLLVLLTGFVTIELLVPPSIDWTQSYSQDDKRPYGDFLLCDLLKKDIFPEQKLETSSKSLYLFPYQENDSSLVNYLFITSSFAPEPLDCQKLLNLARQGNNIFLASNTLNSSISDSLGIELTREFKISNLRSMASQSFNFESPKLKKTGGYKYTKAHGRAFINKIGKGDITVLGRNNHNQIQFIKIAIGKGNIYVHTQPLAFTNYNILLEDHAEYIYKAFSYLPNRPIVWDEYYKPLSHIAYESPIRFILGSPALKMAYYLLIIILIVYMIFQGKRQQRIIPVKIPLKNTTLDFIHTVGRLYYNNKNHKDIATRRYLHLNEFVRSRYHFNLKQDNEDNIRLLSKKSGIPIRSFQILIQQAQLLLNKKQITDEELESFSSRIEYIYVNCK